MKTYRLALWILLCIVGTSYADTSSLTNAPSGINVISVTNVVTSTNIVTLTNTITLANTVTQILPAKQSQGLSIFSVVIAFIVAFIVLQQFLLAKEKFRLDLFEKRLDVYKAVELFVYKAVVTREVTNQDFQEFSRDTQTISFIFGDDITTFVNTLRNKIRDARFLKDEFDKMQQGEERHAKDKEYEAMQLEIYDAEGMLALKFEPYLKFHTWKYGLIWPEKKKFVELQLVKNKK